MMAKKNIAITGGAGFIGSQLVYALAEKGHLISVIDRDIKNKNIPAFIFEMDYADYFKNYKIQHDLVIHLAAESTVAPSVLNPSLYYENNVIKMKSMLDSMVQIGIKNIIFSSTGSVYGNQIVGKLPENILCNPNNTYASTKLIGEMLLKSYARPFKMNYLIFRYFNVCGADPAGRTGYRREPHTHIVPSVCRAILNDEPITIFGSDYKTPDGTCVRDYLHVEDLAQAHIKAIDFMNTGGKNEIINLGGGSDGISVKKIIDEACYLLDKQIPIINGKRREGDPSSLISDISKAEYLLKWVPKYTIREAILHAYNWERKICSNGLEKEKQE